MELARKEVEVFRSAGELRIRQMEAANRKLIEGEEGASKTALEALNNYLSSKERGELDIAAQRQSLELTMQNRAKTLEDYRLKIQEQINKLREKVGKYEKEVADYRLKQAQKEGEARNESTPQSGGKWSSTEGTSKGVYTQGGIGPQGANQYGDHLDIKRTDGKYFRRNELDQYVQFGGKPLSQSTTVDGGEFGASRDGGNRQHRAWDYALGQGAQMELTGGAKWTSNSQTSYGDAAVFMTPDGKTYRVIHGTFDPTAGGSTAPPAAPEMPTDTSSGEMEKFDALWASSQEKAIAIREAMNDLGNSQALENVAKALYPESANRLEGAEDAKARAQAGT